MSNAIIRCRYHTLRMQVYQENLFKAALAEWFPVPNYILLFKYFCLLDRSFEVATLCTDYCYDLSISSSEAFRVSLVYLTLMPEKNIYRERFSLLGFKLVVEKTYLTVVVLALSNQHPFLVFIAISFSMMSRNLVPLMVWSATSLPSNSRPATA
jgi:hypothetical protein